MQNDDTVLIADTHRDMQLLLDSFSEYCNTWKLKINIDKTKSMILRKCKKIRNLSSIILKLKKWTIINIFIFL